jgi:hypothetical protein
LRNDLFNPDNEPAFNFGNNDNDNSDNELVEFRRGNARGRINS